MRKSRNLMLAVLATAPALLAGCYPSSQAFPYDQQTVWRVAVGEAIMWRPERIDDKQQTIIATKIDLTGNELQYQAEVKTDPNIFARRPSTRVYVTMGQTKPKEVRYYNLEEQYLGQIEARLNEMKRPALPVK